MPIIKEISQRTARRWGLEPDIASLGRGSDTTELRSKRRATDTLQALPFTSWDKRALFAEISK